MDGLTIMKSTQKQRKAFKSDLINSFIFNALIYGFETVLIRHHCIRLIRKKSDSFAKMEIRIDLESDLMNPLTEFYLSSDFKYAVRMVNFEIENSMMLKY